MRLPFGEMSSFWEFAMAHWGSAWTELPASMTNDLILVSGLRLFFWLRVERLGIVRVEHCPLNP